MSFNTFIRSSGYVVGCPLADKSAVAAINRALRGAVPVHDTLGISLKCIIGPYVCQDEGVKVHPLLLNENL